MPISTVSLEPAPAPEHALAPTQRSTQLPSVRTLLLWLVFGCLLPVLSGVAFAFYSDYKNRREQLRTDTIQTARAMARTVDAELAKVQLLAQALATFESLERHDFAAFHRRALALLQATGIGQTVVLYDINGMQLVNTMLPFGQSLPLSVNPAQIQRVFSTGRLTAPEVVLSPLIGRPMVSIAVPVVRDQKVLYSLNVYISPQELHGILSGQRFPSDWVVGIFDSSGTIAARTHAPEKYVGKKAVSALLKYFQQAPEGIHEVTTSEGIPTLTAYSRSPVSGWNVAIGISRQSLEAPLMRSLAWFVAGATLLLAVSIGLAWFLGRRITRSAQALVTSAVALGSGEPIRIPKVYLREADDIARAVASASQLLKNRMQALELSHEALIRHEADMAATQRIAKIGSWYWDARTDAVTASPELCRIFGRDFPPLFQQCDVLFSPEAWLELRLAGEKVARTKTGYKLELPALRMNGSRMWVDTRSEVILDAGGGLLGMRGMVQDITERKQSEDIAKSERFIRAIMDAVPGLIAYWDNSLHCRFANKSYMDYFDKPAEAVLGASMRGLMGETMYALNEPQVLAALAGEMQHFERTLTKTDGSVRYFLANYIPDIDMHGNTLGFCILVNDVTLLKQAENELKLAANVYQNIVEAVMVTDSQGIILSVNPAFSHITGYSPQEAMGQRHSLLKSNRQERETHRAMWQQIMATGKWQGEIWQRRKNGDVFLAHKTITSIPGAAGITGHYVSVFYDITDVWQKNENIRHLAFHDALTGLPARSLLMERLERHITLARRDPRPLAVLFLDLDHFKLVNDKLGHDVGDDVLIAVAQKLQVMVRESDTVGRLGGDEFILLLDNPASKDEVEHVSNRIIAAISEPMEFRGKTARVGTSIGIAMYPGDAVSATGLIQRADSAMYEAKNAGKNTFRFFHAGTNEDVSL